MGSFLDGFLYIASPYSAPDKELMIERFRDVCQYSAECLRKGEVVYSPIAHNHVIAEMFTLRTDWPFWRHIDGNMLAASKGLRVLMLPGWEKSVGVQAEIAIALSLELPVEYVKPNEAETNKQEAA